ncbi:RsmB/NOP family class I SAM-dependent RNA methyltransferase [Saezia sanguinis]|uniref:RsmB/NOP family class I SAM-dependent RNA methyltransferase n=1 Tax=Saezia sanguinis TaxID=1965230 RepID=UPI003065D079
MTPQDLLQHAQQLVKLVLRFEYPADSVVSRYFRENRQLGMRERAALAETVYVLIRQKPLLQHLAQSGSGPMERRLAVLAWQADARTLLPMLSEQERAWLDRIHRIDMYAMPEPLRHNLPEWLVEPLKSQLNDEEFWELAEALDHSAPLDLRVNTLKIKREQAQQQLAQSGIQSSLTPYSPWGLRVQGKPALNKHPLFLDGSVEVQDEGSQLLALLVAPKRGDMVVDFCAGAGGKTLALGAAMRNTGRLYAWDVSAHRLDALKPRMARSGLSNVHPAAIAHERDARVKRLYGKVDRVLVDAPCSGLGTLRRNPDLKWRQTPQSIQELAEKQQHILASACQLLKHGGSLVYATCSLLPAENEVIAQQFEQEHPLFERVSVAQLLAAQGVADADQLVQGDYLRLWTHRHRTDGFFAAVWRRKA